VHSNVQQCTTVDSVPFPRSNRDDGVLRGVDAVPPAAVEKLHVHDSIARSIESNRIRVESQLFVFITWALPALLTLSIAVAASKLVIAPF